MFVPFYRVPLLLEKFPFLLMRGNPPKGKVVKSLNDFVGDMNPFEENSSGRSVGAQGTPPPAQFSSFSYIFQGNLVK